MADYVMPRGRALLKSKLAELERKRARAQAEFGDGAERKRQLTALGTRLADIKTRIAGAQLVVSHPEPRHGVRFVVPVTLRILTGKPSGVEHRYTGVGVNEAAAAEGRIAFTAPIARAILGKRVGDKTTPHTAHGENELEITALDYEAENGAS